MKTERLGVESLTANVTLEVIAAPAGCGPNDRNDEVIARLQSVSDEEGLFALQLQRLGKSPTRLELYAEQLEALAAAVNGLVEHARAQGWTRPAAASRRVGIDGLLQPELRR